MPLKKERQPKQEDENPSPSSSSSSTSIAGSEGQQPVLVKSRSQVDDVGNDDADGYHTPTSPSRIIQVPVECPRAPKKPAPPRRRRKRKACCCLIEITDIGSVFCSESVDEGKRSKKPRF